MQKVRLGIIGVGNMGSSHCRSIIAGKTPEIELAAIADISAAKRDWAKKTLPESVAIFDDAEKMMQSGRVDAVLIATPHYLHPPLAIMGLRHGLHVISEKPAGVYTKQVREMNEAAAKSDKIFAIMFNQRTNCVFRKMKELVSSGELGEIKRTNWIITNWYRSQSYYDSGDWRATWAGEGGGVLLNQAIHNLDLWQWIFGMPARLTGFCGFGRHHAVEVEDDATLYASYDGKATAVFICSTGEFPGTNRLEISCEKGRLTAADGRLLLWHGDPERAEVRREELTPQGAATGHNGILQNFSNAIRFGEPLISPGEDGLPALELCNAAYLSAWRGQTVRLPVDAADFACELEARRAASPEKKKAAASRAPTGELNARWKVRW